ncbi:T-complex protein 1 subunit zeta, putative [Plasmodium chabaudi chabaudi]|uniref:T-complex protein 1 subunit zeta, putative n=2 Tax=Plasmodium chabaudi TaxID=5825 RepID=A0A1C6Y787_PLACU|nr:T-complex protein 1 subunit zeta, putative [Plasmodium chabaudi adami]SCM19161.1 T-complex protein 1 subunit zeta, putative [Plasmodium chabaudi chabaudi]SCN58699.1 T-complex protein 1 subunit zeta, putative [Plasmodium chabaudi chabaudi]
MSVHMLNKKADSLRSTNVLLTNINASKGMYEIIKSNLGPKGSYKMLVSASGAIKITKDGNVLLNEMMIQHPTATMLGRICSSIDENLGDGSSSNLIITTGLIYLSEKFILYENIHPRIITQGFDTVKNILFDLLDTMKIPIHMEDNFNKEVLYNVAKTCVRTKLPIQLADKLSEDLVDSIQIVYNKNKQIDLHMIEVMDIKRNMSINTKLVRGMVLDHGCRHPNMPNRLTKCFILVLNTSLEYEKSEVFSSFVYSNAEDRDKLVESERKFTDDKIKKIIEIKKNIIEKKFKETGEMYNFAVFNQKGIDPISLDLLAKENIMALRRIKRRNLERIVLCCGGNPCNNVYDIVEEDIGYAGLVYEICVNDEKYTFIEEVLNPKSCTIFIQAPNDYTIKQIKDAIRDGLRSIKNAIDDNCVISGAGAFEIAAYNKLKQEEKNIKGKQKFSFDIYANSLLNIPKVLLENSGLDIHQSLFNVIDKYNENPAEPLGVDLDSGEPIIPHLRGIYDNYCVKKQIISISTAIAQQILLVDEIIRAGKSMGGEK